MSRSLRSLVVALTLLCAGCAVPAPGPSAPAAVDVAGSWTGRLELPGTPLDLGVTLTGSPVDAGTLDVPAQGIRSMALADVTADGGTVRFRVPDLPGDASFAGTLAADGSAIGGRFTQGGTDHPLVLRRGAVAAPARPQEPQPPFPYRTEDVTYRGTAGDLAGTLTVPEGAGPFPAVLLITGSGAQDRDESLAGHKPFLLLADTLTRTGTAVLRVDDRGVGGSAGNAADATYDDLVGDIPAGLAFLRARTEVDAARVGLLGHSEGGSLAPLVAQRAPEEVGFVIMIAGPAPALEALRVPVLAVYGSKDLQVPAAQNEPVLRERLADNPEATIRTFDGLNHLMQPATTGLPAEYATIETTMDPAVLALITEWTAAR